MSDEKPGRYQMSPLAMIGAMLVTLLVVGGVVAFRGATRDNQPTPVRTVDYQSWLKAGRADGKLSMFAPDSLPEGWRATSAGYVTGTSPRWHLGLLTEKGKYVGIEEARTSPDRLVEQYVDQDATDGGTTDLAPVAQGSTWQAWRDRGGDYGLATEQQFAGARESILVVGTASEAELRDFVRAISKQ